MIITFSKNYLKSFLAPTTYTDTERGPLGTSEGVGVGGGAPVRYNVTNRAQFGFSPWINSECVYSIAQINSE